ncbi:MAG: acyltransferase [Alphaproteobacteria bacterium]|nr:acyltransferase [Alphaproteobacteria bacterium]
MNKNNTKIDQLTSLRFFAAFMIVIHHSNGLFGIHYSGINLGQGVSFFFVLSGFILTYVYPNLNTWTEIKQFLKARIARIVPAYIASFLIAIALISFPWDIKTAIAHLLMIQSWIPSSNYYFSYNAVAWSVSTEFFFYLAFPLLLYKWNNTWFIKLIISGIVLIILVLISNACQLSVYEKPGNDLTVTEHGLIYINPLSRIFEFIIGMSIAFLYKKRTIKKNYIPFLATICEISSIILCAVFMYNTNYIVNWSRALKLGPALDQWIVHCGSVFVFGLLIYLIAQGRGKVSKILCNPFFVLLGEISFSMYLTHQTLLTIYRGKISYFADFPNPITFSIFISILLSLSFLIWACIEMPGRRYILGYKKVTPSIIIKNAWNNNIIPSRNFLFTGFVVICSVGLLESKIGISDSIGKKEDILPPNFNPLTYIDLNPDLEKATEKMTTIMEKTDWAKNHYLLNGKKEGRKY